LTRTRLGGSQPVSAQANRLPGRSYAAAQAAKTALFAAGNATDVPKKAAKPTFFQIK